VSFAVKPVGKPDALIGHVRFDERGWETGRRSGVSARAHPRLYKSEIFRAGQDDGTSVVVYIYCADLRYGLPIQQIPALQRPEIYFLTLTLPLAKV
jgi:hypothetical protein